MSSLYSKRKLHRAVDDTEINPMEGVANLADIMLVLACGLMLALIMSFNVDIGRSEKLVGLTQGEQLTEVDGLSDGDAYESGDAGFEELGKVYRDPATGKLFMVTDSIEE